MARRTREVLEHEEGFLDRHRCLACWDGGMRARVLEGEERGEVGVALLLPLYPRVVSWLQEKMGSYQNTLTPVTR